MCRAEIQEKDNTYMYKFRTKKCTKKRCRNPPRCFDIHSRGMKRRVPEQDENGYFNYIPERCPQWQKSKKCCLGNSCTRAHGWMEIIFHPLLYKTKMCRSYLKDGVCCEYGVYCAKAHHPEEIRNLVEIYGEDWKRHYDLPMKEKHLDSMSITESSQEAIVTLPSKMQSDDNNLDKPESLSNLYTYHSKVEGSPLRIPKLASPICRVESFENHWSYISSPHLHGIYESVCYQMPELFFEPVETSYVDLYGETSEMYEDYIDFAINCKNPVEKIPSECSLYSLPRISTPIELSSSTSSNSKLSSPSLDHSEISETSGSDDSCTITLENSEWSKDNLSQSYHGNYSYSLFEQPNFDDIRKKLFCFGEGSQNW